MTANIFCDIGGEFDALMRLKKKLPPADKEVFVGDLNDRGWKSKQVIEYCMGNPNVIVLDSNHGDMFVDAWYTYMDADYQQLYHPSDFLDNGGAMTLASYGATEGMSLIDAFRLVPPQHIGWLAKLPLFFELPGLIVSHAPIPEAHWSGHMKADLKGDRFNYVWNRYAPVKQDGLFQVFGHNSHWGLRRFGDWAICLDTTRFGSRDMSNLEDVKNIKGQAITALHWPTKEIFQEPYKEEHATQDQEPNP